MSANYQIIVLAAGKGTRMRSELPKVLHQLCGLTLIERTLRAASALRPQRITVVIGFGEQLMRAELARIEQQPYFAGIELGIVVQREQKGTGHAVQTAIADLTQRASRLMILPGDSPLITGQTVRTIAEGDERAGYPDLLVVSYEPESPRGFGRIVKDHSGAIQKIVEEKDCSAEQREIREVNSSLYCGSSEFVASAVNQFKPNNAQGELYFTDAVEIGVRSGQRVVPFLLQDPISVCGANSRYELSQLEKIRRAQIAKYWMDSGVTFEDPEVTYIDEDVSFGEDVVVGAGAKFVGKSVIASKVKIEASCYIENSSIDSLTIVKQSSYIEQSKVGKDCRIGPFAHLRPGTVLHDKVHIGNFVETKQTEMGEGAKANHLTYLGDSTVGAGTNVGAGTITCNYDGVNKHRTEIGERCFIGSNTALVAPITLGDNAYVAAGTVVTANVPSGALAVARPEQKNIPGYAERKRKKTA